MHPETEVIAAYVEGTLSPDEMSILEAHLAECAECRGVATDASLLIREEIRRRRWLVAAPAMTIAAAAALAFFVIFPPSDDGPLATDTERGGSDHASEAMPAIVALLPEAGASIRPDSVRFSWHSASPEALYRFALTDSAGRSVWETTTPDTTLQLPAELRLASGRHYFWYVDALLPDGTEASTGLEEFRTRGR